jgi:hypothetical protein
MIKEVKVTYQSNSETEEINFWQNKSFEEKLSTIQVLREQYIGLSNK